MARPRRTTRPADTGEAQVIETPIDVVAMEPPPDAVLMPVKKKNSKNLFNTELLLEAAQPQFNAKDFAGLIGLCGYDNDPAIRTRVSQLVNSKRLDEKFRPPKPGKKAK